MVGKNDMVKDKYFETVFDDDYLDIMEGIIFKKLGDNCLRRFSNFVLCSMGNIYKLNVKSVYTMVDFLRDNDLYFFNEPSLFLSDEGNIILGSENKKNECFEVEFFEDKIEFFIENCVESECKLEEIEDFIKKMIMNGHLVDKTVGFVNE